MYQGKLVTAKNKVDEANFSIIPEISKNIVVNTSKDFSISKKRNLLLQSYACNSNIANIISKEPELSSKTIGISAPYAASKNACSNKSK